MLNNSLFRFRHSSYSAVTLKFSGGHSANSQKPRLAFWPVDVPYLVTGSQTFHALVKLFLATGPLLTTHEAHSMSFTTKRCSSVMNAGHPGALSGVSLSEMRMTVIDEVVEMLTKKLVKVEDFNAFGMFALAPIKRSGNA